MALTKISRAILDTGISDSSDATAITIDSSERVMIGTTDAGYPDYGDSLTLGDVDGGGGNAGMTIRSGTSSYGTFYFSDATGTAAGTYAGKMQYNHSTNSMVFGTNSSDRLTIDSSGNVGIGTTSPNEKLEVAGNLTLTPSSKTNSPSANATISNINFVGRTDNTVVAKIQAIHNDNANGTDGQILFFTADNTASAAATEKMRINSSGSLLVGTTTAKNNSNTIEKASGVPLHLIRTGDPSAFNSLLLGYGSGGSTANISIRGDGDIENTNNTYMGFSDERIKSNIVDANSQLEDIKKVKVRKYTLDLTGETHIGVIAQELEEAGMSGLVSESEETGYKSVKYSILYMKAIKAIQELSAKVEELEGKIE